MIEDYNFCQSDPGYTIKKNSHFKSRAVEKIFSNQVKRLKSQQSQLQMIALCFIAFSISTNINENERYRRHKYIFIAFETILVIYYLVHN